ncbi:SGNH/GDSL hydrolase family protein [Enterococcus thailandicus]|uniref:SGNH/GDSL hydrolase family protein n=1 Tax=Enterococcus thailandicus TaxID=417368 RepID=UPI0025433E79|nr:SGNH/GDSL hydrolase family protein [Enterococcus thailandicus]MDK4352447.1 SGNH/GDSL hydrolase family protein [Enterococcus thailandicus]MDT2735303.1 SGNH/GDSL hydrolase family protein [Enterococcus thailandicus]
MSLDQFRDVDLVIDKANNGFMARQFISQNDNNGRTFTVQVTDNGSISRIPGLSLNLRWHNQKTGITDLTAFELIDADSSVFRVTYPKHMMNAGTVQANIQVLNDGKSLFTRPFEIQILSLAGEVKGVIDKAEFSALVQALTDANGWRSNIDTLAINKVDKGGAAQVTWGMLAQDAREQISGDKVAVVGENAVSTSNIVDGSLTEKKYADSSIIREKTAFLQKEFTNVLSPSMFIADEYYNQDGVLIKKGDESYLANFGRSDFFDVSETSILYRNSFLGRSATGGIFIAFFAEDKETFIGGKTWNISAEVSSTTVIDDAVYATVAWHNNDLVNSVITKDDYPGYVDARLNFNQKSFDNSALSRASGHLMMHDPSKRNWILKTDFINRELVVSKEAAILEYASNFSWLHGGTRAVAEEDIVIPFDEIDPTNSAGYYWVFIRKNIRKSTTGKKMFKFLLSGDLATQNNDTLKNFVFLGLIANTGGWSDFPNTKSIDVIENSNLRKISFLGDSITTFKDWVTEGNAVFFPNSFITNVEQTWWKKTLNQVSDKVELLVNNSWSGARVTTTNGVDPAGVTRSNNLHLDEQTPDIIINYMGINDFNNKVDIGSYDFKGPIPTTTDTFIEAYLVMLNNETTNYPNAKIYCCTLPYNTRNDGVMPRFNTKNYLEQYNEAIRKCSEFFGAELIELDRIGLNANNHAIFLGDGLHPNELGMELIKKQVINKLIGYL